jgi:anti-sigma factor RsiW
MWSPVIGYKGLYEVSEQGVVRSLPRATTSGRVLRTHRIGAGYRSVMLSKDGKTKRHLVHRLVLAAFVRPPTEGEVGMHANDCPADNRLGNLSWGSMQKNQRDMVARGRCRNQTGAC